MTKKIKLKSNKRKKDEQNPKELRRKGFVPGVIYGSGSENTELKVNAIELAKAYEEAGESTLIDLSVDDEKRKVIIKELQVEPVKNMITHVDFYQVDMSKKIEVEVPLVFKGEAKAEKEHGAVIVTNMETVSVRCLPGELLDEIEIDLSKIENVGDSIRVSDLVLPEDFELVSAETDAIVSAIEKREEVEEEVEETAPEGDEAKVEGEETEEKKEE